MNRSKIPFAHIFCLHQSVTFDIHLCRRLRKKYLFFCVLFVVFPSLYAQESINSDVERYYHFLSSRGSILRPYLNYRTLSDSKWDFSSVTTTEQIWSINSLDKMRPFGDRLNPNESIGYLRSYGPELFISYNSATPYGQNDGALWQGRGINSALSLGARVETHGLELTVLPTITFAQNIGFSLVNSAYFGDAFTDKADTYGYYGISSVDAPQRFGSDSFFQFSWGDSEIRYTYKSLTVGFGTQTIWLGPARQNPIIHSNNAAPYPKLDFGFRKQKLIIQGKYLGDIEGRTWWGKLEESMYFDNDSSNDSNLITGLSLSIAPACISGLTLGLNRTMLSKWNAADLSSIFTLLWPFMEESAGSDERDQRASITIAYHIPTAGFEIYMEWARNDFSGDKDLILRYPFHSQGYTIGLEKSFVFGERQVSFNVEVTSLESSRDYELLWPVTFYSHHIISQGYTNQGQWLGSGLGTGGNSQYVGFTIFGAKGLSSLFISRMNPDNDYVWFMNNGQPVANKRNNEYKLKTQYTIGFSQLFFLANICSIGYSISISDIHNPVYESSQTNAVSSTHLFNYYAGLRFKLFL